MPEDRLPASSSTHMGTRWCNLAGARWCPRSLGSPAAPHHHRCLSPAADLYDVIDWIDPSQGPTWSVQSGASPATNSSRLQGRRAQRHTAWLEELRRDPAKAAAKLFSDVSWGGSMPVEHVAVAGGVLRLARNVLSFWRASCKVYCDPGWRPAIHRSRGEDVAFMWA